MCGLVGFLGPGLDDPQAALLRAAAAIAHRGPDDHGVWFDPAGPIALGHRRLAILDLSAAGHQPMLSSDGRWCIVYNGEIYNHLELRERLAATPGLSLPRWRGHSDTETLLACFSAWGIERTLDATIGMFAIALWDREKQQLYLARDRLGEKPLYYGWVGRGLAFGSELKALQALPGATRQIDRAALAGLMSFSVVPGSRSIYEGIRKLEPGCWLTVGIGDVTARQLPPVQAYWRLADAAQAGVQAPLSFASDTEAADALESVLSKAIGSQLISDVPLGAFLSGGIDSSTTVALMQRQSSRAVRTFSIGFHEQAYDEAGYARAVAEHLGTDHHELYVDERTARDVIPSLPQIYCEPFTDVSQIPTFLVARMAREHVTVSLSGDAGDELFGGYSRYFQAQAMWSRAQHIPAAARAPLIRAIGRLRPATWDRLLAGARPVLPARMRASLTGHRIHRGIEVLSEDRFDDFYRRGFLRLWAPGLVLGDRNGGIVTLPAPPSESTHWDRMQFIDTLSYLPDDILVKVDRAAMAVSLETRVPMLDRRVVEFAWRLPLQYKVRGGTGKWLLRQVLGRHVPAELFDRPKMGFGVPIDSWLRGPLRDWAETLLSESRLKAAGLFDVATVRRAWSEHLSGQRDRQYHLWAVLMFEAWREAQTR